MAYKEDLKEILKEKIREYDVSQEQLAKEWQRIQDLKPKDMDFHQFNRLLQEARYETKQHNLDREMVDNFRFQNPIKVKEWIYKGADKFKLYEYAESLGGERLSRVQAWILEDLHNIKKEKHFPYIYDRDIEDPRILRKKDFDKLLQKLETKKEFLDDEKDIYLIEYDENTKYFTTVDNTTEELFTEDFNSLKNAVEFIKSACDLNVLEKIRENETKYKILVYETKEDYEQGEPFELDTTYDLEEAKETLNKTMKFNSYYAGNIVDTIDEYEMYSVTELDEEEDEEDR